MEIDGTRALARLPRYSRGPTASVLNRVLTNSFLEKGSTLQTGILALALFSGAQTLEADTIFPVDESPVDHSSGDAAVLAKVTPAIVSIFPAQLLTEEEESENDLMDRFFKRNTDDENPDEQFQGVGSGVILTSDGLIVTNSHVVHLRTGQLADSITVECTDRRRYQAKILGADRLTDIALLKVEAENLPTLSFLDSDQLKVGDRVFAVGNPFKIGLTATQGMVSALNRSGLDLAGPGSYEAFIQTDAPINPGNSGGALVDSKGRLAGINTAIYGGAGGNVGIGFAVPANLARQICQRLLEDGEVKRGWLGVKVVDLTSKSAEELELERISGVIVKATLEGAPAAEAGLQPEDLILSVNGKEVPDRAAFRLAVSLHPPEEKVRFQVKRGGQEKLIEVIATLGAETEAVATTAEFEVSSLPGVTLKSGQQEEHKGLEIVSIKEGSAFASKLKVGMLIITVNEVPTSNFAAAETAFRSGVNALQVFHEGQISTLALRLNP